MPPMTDDRTAPGWPALPLETGEVVLWRGRPRADLHFGIETIATLVFALVLCCAASAAGLLIGPALGLGWGWFGAAGIAAGAALVLGFAMLDRARRRRTRYALTTRRAFVHGPLRGTRVAQDNDGWVIDDPARLRLHGRSIGSISFAKRPDLRSNLSPRFRTAFDVGFERIEDAAKVYQMMQAIARGDPPLPPSG
jgi:hypothetical protein